MAEKRENMGNESVKPKASIVPKDPAPGSIPVQADRDSQNLASETLALLKKKDEDVKNVRDLLMVSLKDWVHDLIRRVELVKSEVKSARNVVLPTCVVLDELAEKGERNYEMTDLVNTIMVNVECICKQIPVASSVIGLIMDQLRSLPQTGEKKSGETIQEKVEQAEEKTKDVTASPGKTDEPRKKSDSSESPVSRSDVSFSEAESDRDSVDSLLRSRKLQNPECLPEHKHVYGEETTSQTETEDTSGSKTQKETSDTPESLTNHRIRCLEAKIFEMECTSMIIGDVMRYWITDMLEKIDHVRQEAKLAKKLVYNTDTMIQELPYALPREAEIRVKMQDVIGKAEDMLKQVRSATTLMSVAVNQVMHMKSMEDFREEICATVLAEVPKNPDEIDPSSPDGADSLSADPVSADSVNADANIEAAVSVTAAAKGKGKDKGHPPRQDLPERSPTKSPEKKGDKNVDNSRKSPKKKNRNRASRVPPADKNYSKSVVDQNESLRDSESTGKDESLDPSSVDNNNESTDTIEKLRGETSSDYDTDLSCDSCGTYYFEDEAFEVSITNFAFLDLIEPVTLRNFRKISDCI